MIKQGVYKKVRFANWDPRIPVKVKGVHSVMSSAFRLVQKPMQTKNNK